MRISGTALAISTYVSLLLKYLSIEGLAHFSSKMIGRKVLICLACITFVASVPLPAKKEAELTEAEKKEQMKDEPEVLQDWVSFLILSSFFEILFVFKYQ